MKLASYLHMQVQHEAQPRSYSQRSRIDKISTLLLTSTLEPNNLKSSCIIICISAEIKQVISSH